MNVLDRLRKLNVFRRLPERILERAADDVTQRRFAAADVIWRQGTDATVFTFISDGHVKITRSAPDGENTIIGLFHPGDTLGHVTTDQGILYPGTAVALSPVLALEIDHVRMFELMAEEPELMRAMVDDATRRAHSLVDRIQELTAGQSERRLAGMLVKLCDTLGEKKGDEVRIKLMLSRRDLAHLIHVREETAIRIMCSWQQDDIVNTEPTGFVVRNLARLKALAED